MPASKSRKSEDDLLLQDFSKNVTTASSVIFYINALLVSVVPISSRNFGIGAENVLLKVDGNEVEINLGTTTFTYPVNGCQDGVFWRIHQLDPRSAVIIYVLGAAVSTYMVAFAYKNVKFNLKHKIAVSRDEGVTREVSNQLNNSANGKKINKKERDERVLWKKNQVADYEATAFSIFYNNVLYMLLLIGASFYILRNFSPQSNYILSTAVAAGLVALFSTGS
ncbi:Translocon-associated protein subunit gamma [Trichoplax sp. H2]|nr:Translocon-associated protein subunit gamma [Trichoplax sp. H2]|eukprot:RDD38849.1 Translocon-associated protein subunit gamma [Trichoplax sp. H2]